MKNISFFISKRHSHAFSLYIFILLLSSCLILFLFFFAGNLLSLIILCKNFLESFWFIHVRLDGSVVEQEFHQNFWVNFTWFFAFSWPPSLNYAHLDMVCHGRSLPSAQVRRWGISWLLELSRDDVTSNIRDMPLNGQLQALPSHLEANSWL